MESLSKSCVFALFLILLCPSCSAVESCELESLECLLVDYDNDKHDDLRSVVVIKNGSTVAERYYNGNDEKTLVDVRSAGKSVTSLLFGIALEKGFIKGLDQRVVDYLPESKGSPVGQVRFDHLLTMRTGLDADSNDPGSVGIEDNMDASDDPFAFIFTVPMKSEAGKQYVYNSLAAYTAGLVIGNATNQGLEGFARQHLFGPLGFKDFDWQEDRAGYTKGQGNLFITAPDFARIGLMVLNGGCYDGNQIVSQAWIEESLKTHVDVSKIEFNAIGYGYYWFYQEYEIGSESIAVHFASGNGGNKIYVIPQYDMVVSVMSTAYGQGRGHRRSEDILKAVLAFQTQSQ
jgi:CubicO group peptidase (beta-lactamase class C family)